MGFEESNSMSLFDRTFHPDEANQAFTTGRLIENGVYQYNPSDHHGPTLYYAAAAIQKAAGNTSVQTIDGTLLRCTPLLFGILTLLFSFLALSKILKKVSGGWLIAAAFVLLLGTSPIFAFFATDFIQEMLLACFTAMIFWAVAGYALSGEVGGKSKIKPGTWALLGGISAGLAFATKETSLLTFGAMAIPTISAIIYCKGTGLRPEPQRNAVVDERKNAPTQNKGTGLRPETQRRAHEQDIGNDKLTGASKRGGDLPSHLVLGVAGFALTAVLFYSSFAQNWQGVYNAFVTAPLSYIYRAAGDAASEGAAYHVHPWWQYLKWLFGGNAAFASFSAIGMLIGIYIFQKDRAENKIPVALKAGFIAISGFALSLTAIYSGIPYKTPWCALQMHIPLLLAGFLGWLLGAMRGKAGRGAVFAVSAMVVYWNVSIVKKMWHDPDSKEIAYNYASASPQVKDMAKLIEDTVSAKKDDDAQSFVAVAVPSEDTWPLPFYLRMLDARVGYWTTFEELEALAALGRKPDVVVVPAEQGHLVQPLFPHLKNTKRFEMRRRVRIRVFW